MLNCIRLMESSFKIANEIDRNEAQPSNTLWLVAYDPAARTFVRKDSFRLAENGEAIGDGDAHTIAQISKDGVLAQDGKTLFPKDGRVFLYALVSSYKTASLLATWEKE